MSIRGTSTTEFDSGECIQYFGEYAQCLVYRTWVGRITFKLLDVLFSQRRRLTVAEVLGDWGWCTAGDWASLVGCGSLGREKMNGLMGLSWNPFWRLKRTKIRHAV